MSQRKMPITVQKENHFAIAVNRAAVRVLSIVRQKHNVRDVSKRSYVPQVAIASCLFTATIASATFPTKFGLSTLTL